jgi:hypothetical protein
MSMMGMWRPWLEVAPIRLDSPIALLRQSLVHHAPSGPFLARGHAHEQATVSPHGAWWNPKPAEREQFALPNNRQMLVMWSNQVSPSRHAHRPEGIAKNPVPDQFADLGMQPWQATPPRHPAPGTRHPAPSRQMSPPTTNQPCADVIRTRVEADSPAAAATSCQRGSAPTVMTGEPSPTITVSGRCRCVSLSAT